MSSENHYLNNKVFEKLILDFRRLKKEKARHELLMGEIDAAVRRVAKRKPLDKPKEWIEVEEEYFRITAEYDAVRGELAQAFYELATNIFGWARFYLIDVDDAVQEGVMIGFDRIDRFDPDKGKAFSYMTTVIYNQFKQLYRTQRTYNEYQKRYRKLRQDDFERELSKNRRNVHGDGI